MGLINTIFAYAEDDSEMERGFEVEEIRVVPYVEKGVYTVRHDLNVKEMMIKAFGKDEMWGKDFAKSMEEMNGVVKKYLEEKRKGGAVFIVSEVFSNHTMTPKKDYQAALFKGVPYCVSFDKENEVISVQVFFTYS
jgi:formylmethanofuran dehydrogenase subunit D